MNETTINNLGGKLIASLPAQFLVLVLLNIGFIAGLLWFLDGVDKRRIAVEQSAADARERVLGPLLTTCIQQVPANLLQARTKAVTEQP